MTGVTPNRCTLHTQRLTYAYGPNAVPVIRDLTLTVPEDEGTCYLDLAAENTAEQAFRERHGTLIVVAHRMSSARRADRILVMDGGSPMTGTFTGPPVAKPSGGWVCSLLGGNATCAHPLPTGLPPGYTATFTIPAVVTAPGGTGLVNCAEITNKKDTNPANNKSCVTKQVALLPPFAQ